MSSTKAKANPSRIEFKCEGALPLRYLAMPKVRYVPPPLDIAVDDIQSAKDLPRFFLLGQRDDKSFARTDDGFTIDYVWPAVSDRPVARIRRTGQRSTFD